MKQRGGLNMITTPLLDLNMITMPLPDLNMITTPPPDAVENRPM
ncbi:MAG TPA: hypothetical protein VGO42_06555 [Reyranella sp.]|nr:hypothetical protein [Reyranella sp.]